MEYENAVKASNILFGGGAEDLRQLNEATFLDVFDGVKQAEIKRSDIVDGLDIIAALSSASNFLKSNGEARRALKENSISVNKDKVTERYIITEKDLLSDKFVLLQRGKKNYFLIKAV